MIHILYLLLSLIPAYFAYTYKGFAENCILDREKFGVDKLITLLALVGYISLVMFVDNYKLTFNGRTPLIKTITYLNIFTVMSLYYSKMFYNCSSDVHEKYFYMFSIVAVILPVVIAATKYRN